MLSRLRSQLATLAATFALAALLAAPAAAQEYTIRAGTVAPEGTPWSDLLDTIAKRVEKDTGGRVKFKVYYGGKLGGEESLIRRCQKGTLEMVGVSTGAMSAIVPELDVLELPFLFDGYKQIDQVLDTVVRDDFTRLLGEKGFYLYQWSENGWRHFATKDRFVHSPEDLRGLKIRSQQNKVHIDMWNAWGASPVPLPVPEVPSSLQNNVVSAYDNTLLFAFAAQWHQGIKKVTLSSHVYQPAVVVFNQGWWNKLPADLQAIITKSVQEDTEGGRHKIRLLNKPLVKQYKEQGIEFEQLSDAEKAAFKKAAQSVYDNFRARSAEGARLLDAILAALR